MGHTQTCSGFIAVPDSIVTPLLTAAESDEGLSSAYAAYIEQLAASPFWSTDCATGVRIPWRRASEAAMHPAMFHAIRSPGLYLFGDKDCIPLYLGMTAGPLWNRLRKRYVCGRRSQCQLAADYEHDLITRGLRGFPEEVRQWYRKGMVIVQFV
jgi:hypothetical protein